ncbi:ABC transporter ATP-binding protein [Aquabacterium sp. OR-4]|uniref:ABC transporter ATP-binding protein n=1 Tax=Aquabacterium sp. OR-4 TaxID=2978127 RepID=UPI0021B21104|nr:ABC transporter ATP-binding protein [Aquabacterium sp. OR-4]MDT7835914.1 ABC transporter ATP-binding protein [Aquabacterium sp. OR-4]
MSLHLDGVSVHYGSGPGRHEAVSSVSLNLAAGQIGVLLGPSGCGKTSLLRAVCGLEQATQGQVRLGGQVLADADSGLHVPPEQRQVGLVFQDYALFPHLSVADNIAYGLHALPRAQRRERVQQMLALVDLAQAGARMPHQLSGGQQQRIALARALAPAPRLLLLDEPFSSLDVDLRERLAHEVRAILKQHGTTALVVTHDQLEAFALGDLIGVMNHGRLEQWDSAYALYHRPTSRFVAQFIGHGVFAPARIVAHGGGYRVETALGVLKDIADQPPAQGVADHECEVLLRADDVVHDDDSPMMARIERKAFRGAEYLYTLRLANGEPLLALVPSHHDHPVGEWIGVRPQVDHVVTFDKPSRGCGPGGPGAKPG